MAAEHCDHHQHELFFPGHSEMATRMRVFDLSASDFGSVVNWPEQSARRHATLPYVSFSNSDLVGPNLCLLYNDAYLPWLTEAKHPRALGRPGHESWSEIWDIIGPMLDGVRSTGKASWSEDVELFFDRKVPNEEVSITWSVVHGRVGT